MKIAKSFMKAFKWNEWNFNGEKKAPICIFAHWFLAFFQLQMRFFFFFLLQLNMEEQETTTPK